MAERAAADVIAHQLAASVYGYEMLADSPSKAVAGDDEALPFVTTTRRVDPVIVRARVRTRFRAILRCYARVLAQSPELAGEVAVVYVVEPDGRVDQRFDEGSSLGSSEVVDCVLKEFGGIRYPASPDGRFFVRYRLQLTPEDMRLATRLGG